MKLIAIALLTALAMLPSAGHASPTVRRLYLLCNMEDPSCGPLLLQAQRQFEANPTWTVCIAGPGTPSRECPHGGALETFVCNPTKTLSLRELYTWFMRVIPIEPLTWEEPTRIGIYEVMNSVNGCS